LYFGRNVFFTSLTWEEEECISFLTFTHSQVALGNVTFTEALLLFFVHKKAKQSFK